MNPDNIRIVLVKPMHPGNIGMAARAMKNMGLSKLFLVKPERFPDKEAIYRSSHADDVVNGAVVVDTLQEAISDCVAVFGTTSRQRVMGRETFNVRQAAGKIRNEYGNAKVAILFGCEKYGLSNEELEACQYHVMIPAVESYSSLNLAAAVQVIAYELRMAMLAAEEGSKPQKETRQLATMEDLEGFYAHLEETVKAIGFLQPKHPQSMLPRFRQIFSRAKLDKNDVDLLRGFLKKAGGQT